MSESSSFISIANEYGIKAIRGPRGLTDELSMDLNS